MTVSIESLLGGNRNEIVPRVPWSQYLQEAGLNPSTIVKGVRGMHDDGELILSMLALKHAWDNPGEDTDDLLWGRALHCLLYEPGLFEQRYVRWDGGKRYGGAWDDFRADNYGKEPLTAKQWESVLSAAQAFVREPRVQEIIEQGQSEVVVFRSVAGVQCRGRLDHVSSSRHLISDLKSAVTIAPRQFGHAFYRYFYDLKLGCYRRWFSELSSESWPVSVIALEKEEPWDIAVIPIPDAVLDYGYEKALKVIKRVRQCIESGVWPGITGGEEGYLHVPHNQMENVEYDV